MDGNLVKLVRTLLNPNPFTRISAANALKHPFLYVDWDKGVNYLFILILLLYLNYRLFELNTTLCYAC